MFYPLPYVPKLAYAGPARGRRYFGAPRAEGRLHAGCDLVVPLGTEVFAVDDGVVVELVPVFWNGTAAVAVRHDNIDGSDTRVVRYCEILDARHDPLFKKLKLGSRVSAGQVIAHVGKMERDSMLHFELYSGQCRGLLTLPKNTSRVDVSQYNPKYKRRKDLLDPTSLLDELAKHVKVDMTFTLEETGQA